MTSLAPATMTSLAPLQRHYMMYETRQERSSVWFIIQNNFSVGLYCHSVFFLLPIHRIWNKFRGAYFDIVNVLSVISIRLSYNLWLCIVKSHRTTKNYFKYPTGVCSATKVSNQINNIEFYKSFSMAFNFEIKIIQKQLYNTGNTDI